MDYIGADGWTREDGYIEGTKPNAAGERIHGPLSFSYRPATPREVRSNDAKVTKASYEADDEITLKSEQIGSDFVASKLVSWDLKDRGGHPVPMNATTIQGVHPLLFAKLYNIVRGFALNDPKPEAKQPPSDGELLGNSAAASG